MLPIANSQKGDLQKKQIPEPDTIEILENLQKQVKSLDSVSDPHLINCQYDFPHEYLIELKPSVGFDLSKSKILDHDQLIGALSRLSEVPKVSLQKLSMHGFFVNETNSNAEKESPGLRISITNQMKNFEVIEILCQLGPYSKRYTVLNQFSNSFRHSYSLLGLGTFGEVFLSTDDTQHFAIKCLKFDLSDSGFLRNCIQEFFIADLLSAIEVGPKLLRTKGFDFILFEDCMEFEMEVCRPARKETLETDLKASLLKMHQLKVIHADIKPANVLYSTSYGKNVFLDFGIAEVVNEEIWESTLTKFKGTYEFCGEELKKLFVKKTQEHVNLYRNDLQMLLRTLKYFEATAQSLREDYEHQKIQTKAQIKDLTEQIVFILKYYLYECEKTTVLDEEFQAALSKLNQPHIQKTLPQSINRVIEFCLNLSEFVFALFHIHFMAQNYSIDNKGMIWQNHFTERQYERDNMDQIQTENFQLGQKQRKRQQNLMNATQCKNLFDLNQQNRKTKLQFILLNSSQIQFLSPQQHLEMAVVYLSFTQLISNVTLEQKQAVASFTNGILAKRQGQSEQKCKYMNAKYLPASQTICQKCKNIILFFAYMLSYCMSGQLINFKFKNICFILKECIFLRFQYHMFVPQCLQKFYVSLLTNCKNIPITTAVIQTTQLIYMTDSNFLDSIQLYDSQFTFQLREKLCLILRSAIHTIYGQIDMTMQYQSSHQKPQIMLYSLFNLYSRWKILPKYIYEYLSELLKCIQNEFLMNQNTMGIEKFQKAARYINFQMLIQTDKNNKIQKQKIKFPSLLSKSIIPKLKQNSSNSIFNVIFKIQLSAWNGSNFFNTIQEFDRSHNALFLTFYFFLNKRFREGFIQRDYDLIEKVFKVFLLDYVTAFINLKKFIRFLEVWKKFEGILDQKAQFFQIKILEIKDTILADIIQKIANKFDYFSNYPERQNQIKAKSEKYQNYVAATLREQIFANKFYEQFVNVEVIVNLMQYFNAFFKFPAGNLERKNASNERKIKLLQKLHSPYKISHLHQTVAETLQYLYPVYSIKFLVLQKQIYFLILYLYHQIFSIQSEEVPLCSTQKLFSMNNIKYFQSIQHKDQLRIIESVAKKSPEVITAYHFDKGINFYQKFSSRREFRHLELRNFQHLQNYLPCLKLKRYFVKDLVIGKNNFHYFFFYMIEKKLWKDSFELLTDYLGQVLYGKSNSNLEAYKIIVDTIFYIDLRENFDSYSYSLQFINFLEEQPFFKTNKLNSSHAFPIYLNLLNFRELRIQNIKKFQQVLRKIYKFYPQFWVLPKDFLERNIGNRIFFQTNQQIHQTTLKYIIFKNKKERKYKIMLRQLIKKLHFIQQMGDTCFIREKCNQFIFNFFKVKYRISKPKVQSKIRQSIVKKTKAVLVNIFFPKQYSQFQGDQSYKQIEKKFSIVHNVCLKPTIKVMGKYQYLEKKRDFCKKYEIQNFVLYEAFYMQYYSKNPHEIPRKLSYPVQKFAIINFYLFEENQSQIKQRIQKVKLSEQLKILDETFSLINQLLEVQIQLYSKKLSSQAQKNISELKWIIYN